MNKILNFLRSLGLLRLSIGFVVGVIVAAIPGSMVYRNTVKHYDERFELYQNLTAQSIITTAALREENEKLRTRTVEKTNADGSSEKVTEIDRESFSAESRQEAEVAMLQHTIKQLQESKTVEAAEEHKFSNLSLGLGLTQSGNKYIMFSYPVWNKLEGNAWIDEKFNFGLGLGIRL